jgi:hypothetical protein
MDEDDPSLSVAEPYSSRWLTSMAADRIDFPPTGIQS